MNPLAAHPARDRRRDARRRRWAGIAGVLKATVGAHEVISTIMLNWIAYWVGSWLFGDGGPLQNTTKPTAADLEAGRAERPLPDFWGDQGFQGVHIGFFIALAALVVFWALLNRTTLGYEVRAVGFNPDAAAYGGINVRKNLIRAMAISARSRVSRARSTCSGNYELPVRPARHPVQPGRLPRHRRRPARARTPPSAPCSRALLFGALLFGTTHGLNSGGVIEPELAGNLTYIIQGLSCSSSAPTYSSLCLEHARRLLRRRAKPATSTAELPA